MARKLHEIRLCEFLKPEASQVWEKDHCLRSIADIDSLTGGGADMDALRKLKGVSATDKREVEAKWGDAIAALDPKDAERRAFSWMRGAPRLGGGE